jgi:mannose-1-phosphate guanylyltransferase
MALHAVILAGGSGTRFWPLSTEGRPKHLLALLGRRTLLEDTAARLRGLVPPARTVVVTAASQAREVRRLLPRLPRGAVIAEPLARNTTAAVALAAARIARRDPEAVLVVLAADHAVPDAAAFRDTLRCAAARARAARTLVLIGIRPDRPATGYGYILPGDETSRVEGRAVHAVRRFTEKPDLRKARRWLEGGKHLWNAGLFAWRADVFLEEVERHLPETHRLLIASGAATRGGATLARAYADLENLSLDYGILERSRRVEVIEGTFTWDDLGSYAALARHLPRDDSSNAALSELVALDSRGVLAVAPRGHVTAVLGVEGLAVITAPGVTLVCPLSRAEEVRALAERVASRRHEH